MANARSFLKTEPVSDPRRRRHLQHQPIQSQSDGTDVFPLFQLPRELRDIIFDYAVDENEKKIELPQRPIHSRRNLGSAASIAPMPAATSAAPTTIVAAPAGWVINSSFQMTAVQPQTMPFQMTAVPQIMPLQPQAAPDREVSFEDGARHESLKGSVKLRPLTNMLLLNRQVYREYQPRSAAALTLVLKDHEEYGFTTVRLPAQVQGVRYAELHLVLFCQDCPTYTHESHDKCKALKELESHKKWLGKLLRDLPRLRSLAVNLYLAHDSQPLVAAEDKIACQDFLPAALPSWVDDVPKLKKLTFCKYDYRAAPELDGPKVGYVEWRAGQPFDGSMGAQKAPEGKSKEKGEDDKDFDMKNSSS